MTTISQKKLIVLDGNALVHRAFHALPPFTTRDGLPVGAVYGFTSILLKILKEFRPDYLACTFDLAGPTFRHEAYAEYKAKRVKAPQELYDQIPLVHEVVSAFGIPIYEKQGFEADDVIGTIAREFGGKKISGGAVEVLIFTGDQDTLQLVRPGVKVYALKKGISEGEVMDDRAIKKKFGLKTEQLIDYKILRGDPSDNIPGVPGIGEKTAVELLQKFESVEELYSALHGKG
ncbi:MAG: polA, partial [Candidatus Magasanikbacteria bacterium]|nr:polA [Candidatus Magasanikbacteria bacterium]